MDGFIGRNRKEFSWDMMQKLCELHCTKQEICYFFECDQATIEAKIEKQYGMNFTEYREQKLSVTNANLRRAQLQKAMDGDNTMLIWLGKQLLGQRDKHELVLPETQIKLSYSIPNEVDNNATEILP